MAGASRGSQPLSGLRLFSLGLTGRLRFPVAWQGAPWGPLPSCGFHPARPAASSSSAGTGLGCQRQKREATAAAASSAVVTAERSHLRGPASRCFDCVSLLRGPLVQHQQGWARGVCTSMLAELPPLVLLKVSKELQQDVVATARGSLDAPGLSAVLRRAQKAAGLGAPGLRGPPKGASAAGAIPLADLWSQLLFLLHGRLHQLGPEDVCCLLEVLAAAGAPALTHAHRSVAFGDPSGAPESPRAQRELEAPDASTPTGTPEGPLQAAAACKVRNGGLVGTPQWRPDILTEVEALLLSHGSDVSLRAAIAAVNCPQLLLYPFVLLPQRFLSPRNAEAAEAAEVAAAAGSSSSCLFLELLRPLAGPLGLLASASPVDEKASAYRQINAALGGAPEASGVPGLIGLWHAALSLEVNFSLLSAAALREAEENFFLLSVSSVLLLLRCCCMHLSASSITYEGLLGLQLAPPDSGTSAVAPRPQKPQLPAAALRPAEAGNGFAASLLLKATSRLAQSALGLKPQQALLALEALAHLGFCPGEFVDKILDVCLLRRVPQMRAEELLATLRLLRLLGLHDAELLQSISQGLAESSSGCPLFLLSEALQQFQFFGLRSPKLCMQIANKAPEEHHALTAPQYAALRLSLEKEGITLGSPA